MKLGRVVGTVVATRKDPSLLARRLLVVQPIDLSGRDRGRTLVMLDAVGCGAGEVVYYARGREASFAFLPDEVPADAVIAGIVDHYHADGAQRSGITEVTP